MPWNIPWQGFIYTTDIARESAFPKVAQYALSVNLGRFSERCSSLGCGTLNIPQSLWMCLGFNIEMLVLSLPFT